MSEIGIKDQCFGVEVEMTGITREQAANTLAAYFGTVPRFQGGVYDTWKVKDPTGKVWKLMSDASIHAEQKNGGSYEFTDSRDYQVEMVTPKLTYAELGDVYKRQAQASGMCAAGPPRRSEGERLLRNPCPCGCRQP